MERRNFLGSLLALIVVDQSKLLATEVVDKEIITPPVFKRAGLILDLVNREQTPLLFIKVKQHPTYIEGPRFKKLVVNENQALFSFEDVLIHQHLDLEGYVMLNDQGVPFKIEPDYRLSMDNGDTFQWSYRVIL